MGDTGLEPVTPCVSCKCASQLRQSPEDGLTENRSGSEPIASGIIIAAPAGITRVESVLVQPSACAAAVSGLEADPTAAAVQQDPAGEMLPGRGGGIGQHPAQPPQHRRGDLRRRDALIGQPAA